MSEVQPINVNAIDPESRINVRRSGIDENVDNVKTSIERHGYWPEMAIVVRPHPDADSPYRYEHVTGQCRFKACIALNLETIPAVVLEMDDDEAIQRSWSENENRGDLKTSDKAYWVEKIHRKFSGDAHTSREALEKAAQYLGVTVPTAIGYYTLVALPDSLKDMVDNGTLNQAHARTIVRTTYNPRDQQHLEQSQQQMLDRTDWLLSLEREDRNVAINTMENLRHGASLNDLRTRFNETRIEQQRTIQYAIPNDIYDSLIEWGRVNGLEQPADIVAHIVARTLQQS